MSLLGAVFMILIAGSIQSIYADHTLRDGKGIFKDHNTVNLIELGQEDSKYQVHLLVEVRTAQGQLISITEASHSQIRYIGHEMLSQVIQNLGEKEIITIDGIKFEKVQHVKERVMQKNWGVANNFTIAISSWELTVCGEFGGHGHEEQNSLCVPFLMGSTGSVFITEEDLVTNQWTILRELI